MDKAKQLANQHWGWLSDLLDALGLQEFNKKTLGYIYRTAFQHGWKHAVEEINETTNGKAEKIAGELLYLYGTMGNLKNAYMDSKAMRSLHRQGRLTEEDIAKYVERIYDNLSEFYNDFKYAMKEIETLKREEDEEDGCESLS